MPDKPKIEFGDEAVSLSFQFDSPASSGESQYGLWWIWGVEHDGEDKVLFTNEDLQGTLESIPVQKDMPVAIQKGKRGAWKVWVMDGGDWTLIPQAKPANPSDPAPTPQSSAPPPPGSGPPPVPNKAEAPQKAPQARLGGGSGGISVAEASSVWADCYSRACRILFPEGAEGTADMEQARQAATSIFIAVTNDRSSLPKGFQHAPDAKVEQVVKAVDGEVIPPPTDDDAAQAMLEDDELPFS